MEDKYTFGKRIKHTAENSDINVEMFEKTEQKKEENVSVSRMIISVGIVSYDRDGLKLKLTELAKEHGNAVVSIGVSVILKLIPKETPERILKLVLNTKPIHDLIRHRANQVIRKKYLDNDENMLHIHKIFYAKEGEEGMKLQVELDEIDLDAVFDKVIEEVRESGERKIKKYEPAVEQKKLQEQKVLFETLSDLNKGISAEEKCKLIKMLLMWSNENNVISQVVNTLIREDEDIAEALGPLKLKVGDIMLEY